MKKLIDYIKEAESAKKAVGHFNVSDLEQLHAITATARALNLPAIIGVSEGEREFIGVHEIVALIKVFREEGGLPVFLNADHTHSLEKIEEAARAGFDAVIFDGSKLSFEENLAQTKRAVELAKAINPNILVEGELGYIGSGSEVRDVLPGDVSIDPQSLTSPEQAEIFVRETKIDLFAPAVGNIHGMLANAPEPALDIERIKKIKETVKIPLVLHGASGNTNEEIRAAIFAGINLIHISTELRAAWRHGLEESLKNNPKEVAPYKLIAESIKEMEKIVEQKLRVFNNL